MESKAHLPGGSGGVWRITAPDGSTRVHRPTGPWTPAVHELLAYLHAHALDGVPEVFGFDERGDEVLSYLAGDTLNPETEQPSDDALAAAARWLRRFHDTVAGFTPTSNVWRPGEQALGPGEIICHNDPGLYNWVVTDGRFTGMIDWDRAAPGRPIDDLAFLCWSGVPLLREIPSTEAARRIALAAEAYGDVAAVELLDAVTRRMELITERWQAGIAQGDLGTLALRDSGIMARHEARVAGFASRREEIREQINAATSTPRKGSMSMGEATKFLGDGGIETALEARLGQTLPEFAAYVLLADPEGRDALREYYRPFIELAATRGVPLVLDTATWRANPAWIAQVATTAGTDEVDLVAVNADAVSLVREFADRVAPEARIEINGVVGPRFDEYVASERMSADAAEIYHSPQVRALAEAGADRVTSVTTLDAAEGIGVVRAARGVGVPAVVSFVVGADGLLADGNTLADAIAAVDHATDGYALGFAVNCAHPDEVARGIGSAAAEHARIIGFRLNAAHAGEETSGDAPAEFAAALGRLADRVPSATLFGGCCGTDAPHIEAVADTLIG